MGGVRVFMYFTIQSNIAIDCATGIFMMFRGKRIGSVCHQIRGDSSHHADRCCICRSAGPALGKHPNRKVHLFGYAQACFGCLTVKEGNRHANTY